MQKKTQPLKLVVLLLTLLIIIGGAFVGIPSTLADSSSPLATLADSLSHTLCVGHNNSKLPNSNCNTNTPDPSRGSCQLAWTNGGGGTVALNVSKVTDKGLQSTLKGYNLRCAPDVKVSSCRLIAGANDSGNTKLDLANVENRSPWIYQQLNGKFGLKCNKSRKATSTNGIEDSSGYFYIVSALGARYVDILNGRTDPGTDGIPIIAYSKNYPLTDNQLWQFVPDAEGDGYGYFQSKSGLVLDVQGGSTTTPRTPVIGFTKKSSESDNQLWQFVSDEMNGGLYGYVQNKDGFVLDIPNSNPDLSTPLIVFPKDQSIAPNQIWIEVPQA